MLNDRIRIRLRAYDFRILDQSTGEIADTAKRTGARVIGPIPLPTRIEKFCVLRGPMGHMEGFYHFRREDGSLFRAPIPRFFFQAPPNATGPYLA